MARERRRAGSSVVSMETLYYKQYIKDVLQADEKSRIKTIYHKHKTIVCIVHTEAFTHRDFYTQTLLHTDNFTHRGFYTQRLLHRSFYTQRLFQWNHRGFYTQMLLHTDAFTHRRFYTQTLSHTEAFTHRSFHTQKLLHTNTFTHRDRTREIAILPRSLAIEPDFVRKAFAGSFANRNFTLVLAIEPHFVRKGSKFKSQFYLSFWRLNFISDARNRNFTSFFGDRTSFRAKRFAGSFADRNFASVFGDRTSFRA